MSEATVLRFARRLGYRSYQDLKMDLARDVFSATPDGESDQKDDKLDLAGKPASRSSYPRHDSSHRSQAARGGDQRPDSSALYSFLWRGPFLDNRQGRGYRLFRLGFRASAFDDPHFQLMAAATLREGDVAVGLSSRGAPRIRLTPWQRPMPGGRRPSQ